MLTTKLNKHLFVKIINKRKKNVVFATKISLKKTKIVAISKFRNNIENLIKLILNKAILLIKKNIKTFIKQNSTNVYFVKNRIKSNNVYVIEYFNV